MKRIISALLALLLVGCDGLFSDVSDAEYVSRAQTFLDEGKLKSASIELKNALAKNSDNAQARWLLGRLYVEIGNGLAAEKELNKARNLGVNDDSVMPLLLRAMLLQGDNASVLEQDINSVTSNNIVAELMASRGLAYAFQKKLDKAGHELDAALLKEPDLPYVLTARARLSVINNNPAEARNYLEKALAQNNTYAPAWSLIAGLTPVKEGAEKAIDAYTKAINNRFNNADDLVKRSLLYIQLKRFEDAQNDLSMLEARFPQRIDAAYVQGVLYYLQKQLPEAQASFELVLNNNNNEMRTVFYLGATHFLQGNYEQAKDYLSRCVAAVPNYIPARMLLAQIKLRDREFAAAEALVRPVVKSKPENVPALNILANALIKQGDTSEAVEILEKLVKLQPNTAEPRTRLGVGLLEKGEKNRGFISLESAIEIDPLFQQADIMLVLNYLKENDVEKALIAAKAFVRKQPDNAVAYNMLGRAYLIGKQVKEAEHAFQTARKLVPSDPGASHQLAALALKDKEPEKARTYLKEVLEQYPNHLRTLLGLAVLEGQLKERGAMEATLKKAMEAHPDAIQPRVLLAQEYMKEGKADRARVVLGNMFQRNRNSPAVLSIFGELQLAKKDYANAKSIFKELVDLRPKSVRAHLLLAKASGGLNDLEGVQEALENVLELVPTNVPAKIALTRILLAKGDIGQAQEELASLKKVANDNPEVMALEGAIQKKLGNTKQSLAIYKQIFDQIPATKTLLILANQHWAADDKDGSVLLLEQWHRDHPKDIKATLALANNYLGLERQNDAMQLYRQVLKLSEDNLLALNNLAWHLRKSDPEQALSYARRASVIAPESVTVIDTLAVILMEMGRIADAHRLIEHALEKQPEDSMLRYRQALILEKRGQEQEAKSLLETLLNQNAQFPERAEAVQLLERLKRL